MKDLLLHAAVGAFVAAWREPMLLDDLGERLTCHEADALLDLFRVAGDTDAHATLLDAHSRGDDEDDSHYQPRCDADALHGTGTGICDAALDEHGVCPNASRHVETTQPV